MFIPLTFARLLITICLSLLQFDSTIFVRVISFYYLKCFYVQLLHFKWELFQTLHACLKSYLVIVVVIIWQLDIQLPVQSVPITINVVSSNPADDEVYSKQHYVIKFVIDLRQVSVFLWVLWFPPLIKPTATI